MVPAKGKLNKYLHTIRARILLSTVMLIVIISIIITSISYFVVSSSLQKNLIQTSETKLAFLCSSIDSNIDNVIGFIRSCRISSKIKNFAGEKDTDSNGIKREAHDFIIDTYAANAALPSSLIRLVVIGKERSDIVQVVESPYSTIAVSADAILSLPYFNTLHSNPGEVSTGILMDPFFTTKQVPMIPFVHTIEHPYKAEELGYIYTEMSLSVITGPIKNYLSETDSRFFFQIGDYRYEYSDHMLTPSSVQFILEEDLSDISLSSDTIIQKVYNPESKSHSIMITRPLGTKGWYVTECLDQTVLSKNIYRTFFLIALIILTSASIIGILLSWFLSKTVNVPVHKLQERMKRIAGGDFERDPSTEWGHELGDIGKNINDLSENVQLLMDQRIADERQKKDYEYKMLQSQINPHFIYNTLNSIKWMATIQNASGIAEMTTSLSRLLKDIAKGTTNLVTLEHEISLINDYFTIQQYRYGGTITLHYNIEDETLNSCRILKFTLQPIVENSIFHGIEPKGNAGSIEIHIYRDETGDIRIDITDDGVGMTPEVAAHLLDTEAPAESSFFKEFGISNVHKRLQYEFGDKYGLSVKSKIGEFTTISILLPFQLEPFDSKDSGAQTEGVSHD
ncbi:two-component system sensor histidine kinase YesM [Kineothrix alysoides]|uniref:Two-component system sensor histidine kinase YesM n=1 Tax=Kineothrix alysoides TaxID=1469948 RepID=A0A4R1QTD2_9FIRM|nr:sensor histidine kinase [Kineothrix alysoides]TCL57189.1 two-component system sensor histidine kinase YesM [Kineothrix alysoides]